MKKEIERKFKLTNEQFINLVRQGYTKEFEIIQAYDGNGRYRRIIHANGELEGEICFKRSTDNKNVRYEQEYEIDSEIMRKILAFHFEDRVIHKQRFTIDTDYGYYVDLFSDGMILFEVEFEDEKSMTSWTLPEWLDADQEVEFTNHDLYIAMFTSPAYSNSGIEIPELLIKENDRRIALLEKKIEELETYLDDVQDSYND